MRQGIPVYWSVLEKLYTRAAKTYALRPLDCPGVNFRTCRNEEDYDPLGAINPGWDGLFTKGLQTIRVEGNHHSIIREKPNMQVIAKGISGLLSRLERGEPNQAASAAAGGMRELGLGQAVAHSVDIAEASSLTGPLRGPRRFQ
ncbi:hypothetical protein DSM21852_07990 [Methylocystis bryophila]|nr:hypothetical protein DSM21852_07990 [Methylocystis bryophila]